MTGGSTGPRPDTPAVEVRGLRVDYGDGPVLADLDLEVAEGEVLGLLGPSGCGKTTLLRSIAGFIHPNAGSVHLAGRCVAGDGAWVAPERRNVGLVPQEGALFPHLDVGANIAFGLIGVGRAERSARVAECLELVGLPGAERRRPRDLSGGQQQRVALARALAPDPSVVLLDEPFSALDAALRIEVREQVRSVLVNAGATAVLVTHDQEEALSVCQRVAVMRDGGVAQIAEPTTLYRYPVDLGVGEFVGESFRLNGHVSGARVHCELGSAPFHTPATAGGSGWSPGESEPVTLLMRPEQVDYTDAGADTECHATVESVTYYGHDMLVKLAIDPSGTQLLCRTTREVRPDPGDRVAVSISGEIAVFPPA